MRLAESILNYYECRKTSTSEEVETVIRDGKKYWFCPHSDFEMPIVDKVAATVQRKKINYFGLLNSSKASFFCKKLDTSNNEKGKSRLKESDEIQRLLLLHSSHIMVYKSSRLLVIWQRLAGFAVSNPSFSMNSLHINAG
jgi:hypothetical protein